MERARPRVSRARGGARYTAIITLATPTAVLFYATWTRCLLVGPPVARRPICCRRLPNTNSSAGGLPLFRTRCANTHIVARASAPWLTLIRPPKCRAAFLVGDAAGCGWPLGEAALVAAGGICIKLVWHSAFDYVMPSLAFDQQNLHCNAIWSPNKIIHFWNL